MERNRERLLDIIQGGDGKLFPCIERVHYRADTKHPETEAYILFMSANKLHPMETETLEQARSIATLGMDFETLGTEEAERRAEAIPVYDYGRYMAGVNPFLNAWNRHYTHPEEFTPEELAEAEILRHSPRMGEPLPASQMNS